MHEVHDFFVQHILFFQIPHYSKIFLIEHTSQKSDGTIEELVLKRQIVERVIQQQS